MNLMAMNLTESGSFGSLRDPRAVVGGDLMKKIEVNVQGEILELKKTVNQMTEGLSC